MTERCLSVEELGAVESLPPTDARRLHAESCPRCGARLEAYRDFMRAEAVPAGADLAAAEARLDETVREAWASRGAAASGTMPRGPAPARAAGGGWADRLAALLGAPRWRPAWALAAAVVVAGGVWLVGPWRSPDLSNDVVRGAPPRTGTASAPIEAQAPRFADGGVELRWAPVAGAESYEVVFYQDDLSEAGRRAALLEPSLRLSREELSGLGTPAPSLWQVVAKRSGEEIARSAPERLLPR